MSVLRRSARIANRNASKPDSKPLSKPLFDLGFNAKEPQTNPSSGWNVESIYSNVETNMKSPQPAFDWNGQATPSSDWQVEYKLFTAETDMKNPSALAAAIAHHERVHKNDDWYAYDNSDSQWERELIVTARWLCIDNRILKESPEMYKKAEKYSFRLNDLMPKLYEKIEHFEEQLNVLKGYEANKVHRQLLMSRLLLTLSEHVHDKWNIFWNDIQRETNDTY